MSGPSEDADAASTLYLGSEDYVVRLDCLLVVYQCTSVPVYQCTSVPVHTRRILLPGLLTACS